MLTLGTLVAALAALAMLLLVLNAPVYAWFFKRRGLAFAVGAVLAHWIYFLYSFAVFILLALRHVLTGRARAAREAARV